MGKNVATTAARSAALLFVVGMFAAAGYAGDKELVFPEAAALAFGAWAMEVPPWRCTTPGLWLSPTLAAATGVLLLRLFPLAPAPVLIAGAFILVILQLRLMRSAVLPAISAAILPLVMHSDSWRYPLYVCLLTGIVALGRQAARFRGPSAAGLQRQEGAEPARAGHGLLHWGKLWAGIVLVAAAAFGAGLPYMIAPPLIVAFVELAKPAGKLRSRAVAVVALLALAALAGVLWLHVVHNVLQWPMYVAAGFSLASVFLLFDALRLSFPPAAAIALLPAIIPDASLWAFPWHVLLGSAAFVLMSLTCFGRQRA